MECELREYVSGELEEPESEGVANWLKGDRKAKAEMIWP